MQNSEMARDVEDDASTWPSTAKAPAPLPVQGEDQHLTNWDQQIHGVVHQMKLYFPREAGRLPNMVEGADYDSMAWVNKIPVIRRPKR